MIGMFVADEDSVELFERDIAGREARQSFAFAKTAIHQKSGVLRFEQRDVARTAGSENGDAQAYRSFSENLPRPKTIMGANKFLR